MQSVGLANNSAGTIGDQQILSMIQETIKRVEETNPWSEKASQTHTHKNKKVVS